MRVLYMLSIILSFIASACTKTQRQDIYETTYNDKKFRIQSCIRKTYNSNYLYYRFILDNSKPFDVNSLDYQHGLPYTHDVFNGAPSKYFDTTISYCVIENPEQLYEQNSAYLHSQDYPEAEKNEIKKFIKEEIYKNLKTERKRFLLYLDPQKYSLKEFEDISNVLNLHIKEINELIFSCKPFQVSRGNYDGWQFCGLVYGNEDDFCEVYSKSKEDFFKVFPDGRIAHYNELSAPGKNWLSGQDFIYSKIKMPGKIIQLKTYSKDDLAHYQNKKGESITSNFKTEQGPSEEPNK